MYTQCPKCSATYRVTAPVLQQARGRVRCGGCSNSFSAIDYLSEDLPDASTRVDAPAGEPGSELPAELELSETGRQLLETLDELSGSSDVRIEDTGIEWRVLDGDYEDDQAGDAEGSQSSLDLQEAVPVPAHGRRFDDIAPHPDGFGNEEHDEGSPELDQPLAGLALSEPGEWAELLEEVREGAAALEVSDSEDEPTAEDIEAADDEEEIDSGAEVTDSEDETAAEDVEAADDEEEIDSDAEVTDSEDETAADDVEAADDEEEIDSDAEVTDSEDETAAEDVEIEDDEAKIDPEPEIMDSEDEPAAEDVEAEDDAEEMDPDVEISDSEDKAAAETDSSERAEEIAPEIAAGEVAATARDEPRDFAAALASLNDPAKLFDDNAFEVETIIMEGETVRNAIEQSRLQTEHGVQDRFGPTASLHDTYASNRAIPGGRRSTDPPAKKRVGVIAGSVLLALLLAGQVIHAYRETLSTYPLFNQTIGSVYRALGQPITPEWNIKGWQFEETNGSIADDKNVLTILSRIGNNSQSPLPYPLVHVSLTDRFEEIVGSRVLTPDEYLAGDLDPGRPVIPGENFTAVITIDEPSAEATGFKLNVCYREVPGKVRCATEDFKN